MPHSYALCCCFVALVFAALGGQAAGEAPREVNDARARAAGIRKLESRHLVLYTDVPSDPEVDRLPELFDQAVPQWAEYFDVSERRLRGWQAHGFLIKDRERFDALGLMPVGNDEFPHGISIGPELWLYDQPTPYYRRHLLLHEGTHVFMATLLGGCGPGWYMEGTAELMATHQLETKGARNLFPVGQEKVPGTFLALRTMPARREEVPMLGRIKLIDDARAADRVLGLEAVMKIDNRRRVATEGYAWCWAAAKFLDSHPRYGERFRKLRRHVTNPHFDNLVRRAYADDWLQLVTEWQAFVATLDYGYDFERMAIEFERGTPLGANDDSRRVTVAADRGWQSSGVWLEAGKSYRVAASGRYQIAAEEVDGTIKPWACEPGGVTIEYHDGRPLGMLLAAVVGGARSEERGTRDESAAPSRSHGGFAEPIAIGLETVVKPAASGTLYVRVNDSGGRLADNRGQLVAVIEAEP